MFGKEIEEENCIWSDVFDNNAKITLFTGWTTSGRIGFFLTMWLNINLWCTNLKNDLKYRNLASFTTIMCVRRGLQIFLSFAIYMEYNWDFDIRFCSAYGILDTFLGVYEVESLTHICIERYVVAKYLSKGWRIKRWHYILYGWLCLFFSLLYSLAPWFGIGNYVRDFTCLTCAYNMILPNSWEKYVLMTIYLLRSVKPLFFMMIMLHWTQVIKSKYNVKKIPWAEARFTHVVDVITVVSIACWAPITVIRGLIIIIFNYVNFDVNLKPFVIYIQWAIWIELFTPAIITLTLLNVDLLLRAKMFGIDKKEEDVVKLYENQQRREFSARYENRNELYNAKDNK